MRGTRAIATAAALLLGGLSLAACGNGGSGGTGDSGNPSKASVKVGLAYDIGGRGDKSFNDAAAAGLDKAKTDLDVAVKELEAKDGETDADKEARLKELADAGYNPVVAVGFAYAPALKTVAADYPDVHFMIIDDSSVKAANVASYTFKENEAAAQVGYVAALTSTTGTIGFVGGVNNPLIQKFQAGYDYGAKQARPEIKVVAKYLTDPPDFSGFADPAKGKVAGSGLYDQGADVVYAAAGLSNNGVFDAAAAAKKYVIGTDSDQYLSADPAVQPWIIASALKGVDTAVFDFIEKDAAGTFTAGNTVLGLKEKGVGYVINNAQVKGKVDAKVQAFSQKIVSGQLVVPEKLGG